MDGGKQGGNSLSVICKNCKIGGSEVLSKENCELQEFHEIEDVRNPGQSGFDSRDNHFIRAGGTVSLHRDSRRVTLTIPSARRGV